ncbi:hypothetical protein F0P96_08315 [Hymenobacter busanensis]|uniref:Uncharacterized protein n=1 Tax=Hymenobacter busanensis TaxID=2607656 RepID=A0A7L4ZZ69_9BACT|nr:hypothetical protein [Hymenobacter busanensis]KAA9332979.1 hypothetical protein F0P96_08315 [Hymenobacter busanensis]QHJ08347.1 hypothetical protein GUY19_14015 [Hymenobacter busanensis]
MKKTIGDFMKTTGILLSCLSVALLIKEPAQAQRKPAATPVTIKDCYRVVQNDSVQFFYNGSYQLMPVACGDIVRACRVNGQGNLEGRIEDRLVENQHVVLRGHYVNNIRHGAFEMLHPATGKPLWQGAFIQGKPTGEWKYWYDDARPKQVLRYTDNGLELLQCWDEKGQQILTNGNGAWLDAGGVSQGGTVVNGRPHGRWEAHTRPHLGNESRLLTTEFFEYGRLMHGTLATNAQGEGTTYQGESRLLPLQPEGSYMTAESFVLSALNCEQMLALRAKQSTTTNPIWPKGADDFRQLLNKQLQAQAALWPQNVSQVIVRADITTSGKLFNIRSEGVRNSVAKQWLEGLDLWKPAVWEGKLRPGGLFLKLEREAPDKWNIQIETSTLDQGYISSGAQ